MISITNQLTIFRGIGSPGRFTWSPFVTKLEARLRFDNISYSVAGGTPLSAPRGKLPYVELGTQSPTGDTTLVIDKLIQDGIIGDLNAALSPVQRAHDVAIKALMEDKLYFYNVREKWCDNYTAMRDCILAAVPWPVRAVLGLFLYRGITRTLHGQGTGRFTDDEIAVFKKEVWVSIDALLKEARSKSPDSKEPFWVLGGERPTESDAIVFASVATALLCEA